MTGGFRWLSDKSHTKFLAFSDAFSINSLSVIGVSGIFNSQPCRIFPVLLSPNNKTSGNNVCEFFEIEYSPAALWIGLPFSMILFINEIISMAQTAH